MFNIKEKIEELLVLQSEECEILEIYKTGSQLFRDSPTDLDYIAICRGYSQRRRKEIIYDEEKNIYDIMIYDEKSMKKQLDFNDKNYIKNQFKLFNYFICFRDAVYSKWDFEWNILDYEKEYKDFLKNEYQKTVGKRINKKAYTKNWVHYYIVLKIYDNNKVDITDEMINDIKTLYEAIDGSQVPIINWIEEQLYKTEE